MDINGVMKNYSVEEMEDTIVFYCTRCLSLGILEEKNSLKCGECGAKSDKIDVTNIHKWSALYREKYGSDYVSQSTTIYDDLAEFYGEEAYATLDETEALRNGLIVRDCVNLRLQDI